MILRQVMGRLVNRGIDASVGRMTRGAGREATPEQQTQARQTAGRVKQALQLARSIGRF